MRNFLFFVLLLISTNCLSQNKDSYFAFFLKDYIYTYFDSLGIYMMEPQPDTCDCVVNYNSSFIAFDKKENCFDSLLLNENADELSIQEISEDYIKIFRSWGKSPFQSVFVDVGIIQVSNRFSILRLKRRVKYRIEMLIYYNPYEKKEY